MPKGKRAKPRKTLIDAFISHRCEEYDNVRYQPAFAKFLKRLYIRPRYGCLLDKKFGGIISENIRASMEESKIFIAIITPSWESVNGEGWPKREWEMWKKIHENNLSIKNNCIGFFTTESRDIAPFIKDLVSFPVFLTFNKKIKRKDLLPFEKKLFGYIDADCWVKKEEYPIIMDRIERMHLTARKQ